MKTLKLIFIIFILCYNSCISFSQQWEKVYDNYRFSAIKNIQPTTDKGIIIGIDAGMDYCMYPIIFKFDSIGNLQWQKNDYGIGTDVILITQNNDVLFTGYNFGQDDVGGDEILNLSKINSNGDYIFNDSVTTFANETEQFHPIGLSEFQNKDILIYSVNRVIRTDSIGHLIWNRNFSNVDSIKYLHIISNNQFLISNTYNLYKTDYNGIILDSLVQYHKTIIFYNDTIYLGTQNKIIKLDAGFNIIDTIDFSNTFMTIQQIIHQNSNFWLKGTTLDGKILINKFSDTFQPINTYIVPINKIDTTALFCVTDYNFFLASERLGQCAVASYNQNIFLIDSTIIDISPESLNIDNIQSSFVNYGGQLIYVGFSFDAHVTIKNNGINTVDSLSLYSIQTGYMNCAINFDYEKFKNITLLPNQSVNLDFLHIYEMIPLNNTMYHYCLKCLAPNSSNETNISNNSICGDFLILNVDESKYFNPSITISPNPFIDKINIQTDIELLEKSKWIIFELTEITGKKIISKPIKLVEEQIKIPNLNKGIYFGIIKTDKLVLNYKLIKM